MQETETVLEAAIRAGISLSYGCSSGTCGECKARLVQGTVREIRSHEYAIAESERLQGYILACANTACEDLVIDAVIANSAQDIPLQEMNVRVRKIEHVTSEVMRLIVQTPRTTRLRFLAGQYVELQLSDIGTCHLAIASCPCEDRLIEFHVRVREEDPFSHKISETLKNGDTIGLRGPLGEFVYDESSKRPVILFAFDTGFAAIKSLLEHITAQEQELPILLIWMSCGNDGLYMNNLCRSWNDAFDAFSYTGISLEESLKDLATNPEQGRATLESHIRAGLQKYPNLSDHDVYISAPAPVINLFKKICCEKNIQTERFYSEPVRGNEDLTCIFPLEFNK